MWLLECEGDLLGNKKLWLKPGNKYVLGRVPSPEGMMCPYLEGKPITDMNSELADAFAKIDIESPLDPGSWGGRGG